MSLSVAMTTSSSSLAGADQDQMVSVSVGVGAVIWSDRPDRRRAWPAFHTDQPEAAFYPT